MVWKTVEWTAGVIEAGGFRVSGVARDTRIGVAGRHGGVAAAYARPVRLEVDGPNGPAIMPIPDIQLRIIALLILLPLLYEVYRRRRSR